MLRTILLIAFLLIGQIFELFVLSVPVFAADQKVNITWEHPGNQYLHHWVLRSNGDNATKTVITGPALRSWSGTVPVIVGQNYLELQACTETQCSVWSNKACFDYEGTVQAPTELNVTIPGAEVEVSINVKAVETENDVVKRRKR